MYGSTSTMRKVKKVRKATAPVRKKKEVVELGGEKVEFKKGGLKKSLDVPEDYTFKKSELERLKGHEVGKKFQFKGKKFTMDEKLKKQITLALTLMSSKK
tara:strand:+ start:2892 stop:3191 length:300 start_codon:yes stop_codon:yes gene_type:complete